MWEETFDRNSCIRCYFLMLSKAGLVPGAAYGGIANPGGGAIFGIGTPNGGGPIPGVGGINPGGGIIPNGGITPGANEPALFGT